MNIQSNWLLAALMSACILSAGSAGAQETAGVDRQNIGRQPSGVPYAPALHPGDRVRLHTANRPAEFVGTIIAVDDTTITLQADQDGQSTVLHRKDITSLEVSVGETSRGKHALAGAGIGAGLGAVLGLASGDDSSSDMIAFSAGEKALMLGVSFAVVGTLVGLVLPAGEQWLELPLNSQVSIDPAHGAVEYSLVYRF